MNRKKRFLLVLMAFCIAFSTTFISGCKKLVEKELTPNEYGFAFKHCLKNENTPKARLSDVVYGEMEIRLNDSTILFSNFGKPERLFKILNPKKGNIDEFLLNLHVGDSAIIIAPADSVSKYVAGINSNHKDKLYFYIKVQQIISKKEIDGVQKEQLVQEVREDSILNAYASTRKYNFQKQESGLYFIKIKDGVGENAKYGQKVRVNYSVTTLEGKVIDTNIKPIAISGKIYSAQRKYEPFEFVLGDEGVIAGWNEGISLMKLGSRAKLLLPSKIAYGAEGYGIIPAYTSLIFDVTLVGIQ